MATEEEVERARRFWLDSPDDIAIVTLAKYAEHERKRIVDAIVAKIRVTAAQRRESADDLGKHCHPSNRLQAPLKIAEAQGLEEFALWIEREFGGGK